MNWDQITGKMATGRIKERWGKPTDDDLAAIAGKREQIAGKLPRRYGYAKEQAQQELDDFARTINRSA